MRKMILKTDNPQETGSLGLYILDHNASDLHKASTRTRAHTLISFLVKSILGTLISYIRTTESLFTY